MSCSVLAAAPKLTSCTSSSVWHSRSNHCVIRSAAAAANCDLVSLNQIKPSLSIISRRLASCLLFVTPARFASSSPGAGISSGRSRSMAAGPAATNISFDLEAFGKAASGSGSPSKERGDCPFSQRIYLELEEKGLPYTATYIEEGPNKPDWFMAKNPKGLMPVLRDGEQWIQDSDKIAQHLEEKYPQHSLKTPPQFKQVGSGVFPAFTSWLKTKNAEDPSKQEYLKELKALNDHLKVHGPFIAGKEPTDSDFALAPKLRHARVALKHHMAFIIPKEYSEVVKYIEMMESRPSFRKTDSPDDMIIQGWQKKFDLPSCIVKESQHA